MSSRVDGVESSATTTPVVEDESTPLLLDPAVSAKSKSRNAPGWLRVVVLNILLAIILDFANYLAFAPQTEIFQDIICRQYYSRIRDVPYYSVVIEEGECKIGAVQGELALINGWKDTFDQIPGILLALPYGVLADRIGRKPVICMGIFGATIGDILVKLICWWPQTFPLRLVWLSTITQVIGGGSQTASSMLYVMLADVISEDERANTFFLLTAGVLLTEITATPISAALMTRDPWIPYALSAVITIVGALLALGLPETLGLAVKSSQASSLVDDNDEDEVEDDSPVKGGFQRRIVRGLWKFNASTHFIRSNPNVMLILFIFLVAILGRQSPSLLLQYISKKFNWTIARATFLISLRGAVNLALLLVIMPLLGWLLLERLRMRPSMKDLRLSQGSSFLLIVGLSIVGFADSIPVLIFGLVILALGSALIPTARSLATSLVLPVHVGTLYAAIAVVQAIGTLIAGPVLANAFRWGMSLGDQWLGLPFLVAALFYLFAFVAVSCIRLPPEPKAQDEEDNEVGDDHVVRYPEGTDS